MFTEPIAVFLTGPEGRALISESSLLRRDGADTLRALSRLRKSYPADIAGAAWDLVQLRHRASGAMGEVADRLFFDRDGYQMASAAACASYHADLVASIEPGHVLDLCAGIGIDALSIAGRGVKVTAYELDPARAVFARANAKAAGLEDRITVIAGDVTQCALPGDARVAFFDPARRDEKRTRIVAADQVLPPLDFLTQLARGGVDSVLVKLSPAIDRSLGAHRDADTEFLAESGECKEGLLRTGRFRTGAGVSAVILPGGRRLNSPAATAEVREDVGEWLYEPDAAVIRAGLVGHVASEVDGWLIDPRIAYVFSNRRVATPFADAYRIEVGFPYHRKRLQDELASRHVGRVIVKRRGFPEEPDAIRKQLKLTGGQERIVLLTRSANRLWAMVGTRERDS